MDDWSIWEWALFTIAGVWALLKNLALREHYRHYNFPDLRANSEALIQLTSFAAIGAEGYSPYHLIWLFALSFLSAFLALRITFCTWIAWLYGFMIASTVTVATVPPLLRSAQNKPVAGA